MFSPVIVPVNFNIITLNTLLEIKMKKTHVTEYFGGTEKWTVPPRVASNLEFDDKGVENIA